MKPLKQMTLLAALVLGGAGLPVTAAGVAHAAPVTKASAGGVRLHSNVELARTLARIERASDGRVDVSSIGQSNEGRPLWLARLGNGPVKLLYVTQQHGDEPLGTESAIHALRTLGLSRSAAARDLRSKITLGIIVRANPDGHERNWRFNFDPDAEPEFGEPGKGFDINRYHNPSMAPEDNPVPEAAAIQREYAGFGPAIVVDYHMQGRHAFPDGREITTSMLWPTNPTASADAVRRSKQVVVRVHDAFTGAGAVVSQYPGGDFEGIARNAYGIRGSASVLVELSSLPPQREHFQVKSAYVSMVDLAFAAGRGELAGIDPSRAEAIPPRGPELPGTENTESATEAA